MKKRNHKTRMAIALAFALSLSLSSPALTGMQAYAAQVPVNEELTTPFGQVAAYDAEQGIGVVWGAAGYDLYTVTISCKANGYEEVYANQTLEYHWYPDSYAAGEYLIEIQGQQGDELSKACTATVTVAGDAASGGSGQEDPVEGGNSGENGAGEGDTNEDLSGIDFGTIDHDVDYIDGGTDVTVKYDGVKAVVTGTDWGNDWGGDSRWQVQLKEVIDTPENEKYNVSFKVTSDVARDIFVKLGDLNNDATVYAEQTVSLSAGVTEVSITSVKAVDIDKMLIDFALGTNGGSAENTIVISNFKVAAVKGGEENTTPEEDEQEDLSGIDFETLDHSGDYIDAGTDVTVKYEGVKATVAGTDWGNDWGGDSHWQIQLKEVVDTPTNERYDVSFNIRSDVAREIFVKLGDIDNDATVYAERTINLVAGTNKVIITSDKEVDIDKMLIDFALGTKWGSEANTIVISNLKVKAHKEAGVKEGAISFEDANTEFYVGNDWSGSNADIKESGTKAVINASSYGWNGEWGIQYKVKELGLEVGQTYTVSADFTSSINKKLRVKLDDSSQFFETIDMVAGETYEFSKEVTITKIADDTIYFAPGQMDGETANLSGTLTIENFRIQDADGNYLVLTGGSSLGEKGPEYDWANKNSELDYADPGRNKDGYKLIWADEFDGNYGTDTVDANGLNLNNWAYQLGDGTTDCGNYGWGNNELQCYTDNATNVGVNEDLDGDGEGEGVLRISAVNEPGYKYANESAKNYTSARLRTTKPTEALFDTTYGYVEARISLPGTAGAWPAFWMLPESTDIYGGWPVSGEIDIMETCGAFNSEKHNIACGTLHWGVPTHVYKGSGYVDLFSDYTYFHTYAVDWEPGKMTWYYDGQPIKSLDNWTGAIPATSDALGFDAPFDMPFYMILNLAVDSGQFGGSVNKAGFKDDINMYVDYVRVFQREGGYADSVLRGETGSSNEDWKDLAGVNQIADISAASLDNQGGGLEDAASDDSKWYLSNQDDGTGATLENYTDADGKTWAKVGIANAGSKDYSVQLIGHYNAKAGYVYKVSFDAYAEGAVVGKSVNCDSKEWAGWSTYGVKSFELSNTPASYSYTFKQTEDFDKCRIEFNLGSQGAGSVYVSNVRVEIVDPATLGESTSTRGPLANGNLIYNGSFDQGNLHFGYWDKLDGTEVSIPRYTTENLTGHDLSVVDVASKSNYENISDGIKYYERRAQISSTNGKSPVVYQPGIDMAADKYQVKFDLYSEMATSVKVSAYSVGYNQGKEYLDKELGKATASYDPASGVRSYSLFFNTAEDAAGAALVFTFEKGTAVQLDNVYLHGENQKSDVDEHPLDSSDENAAYRGDSGAGSEIPLTSENGVITMSGITSGGSWYSPQLASPDFKLVAGQTYKLTYDYKLEGTHNNTFQYIIQENGGSWHVYGGGPTTVNYDKSKADADGFQHYEFTFTADATISAVHVNYGFGNSGANGDMKFSFKNADMELVKAQTGSDTTDDSEDVDDDKFDVVAGGEDQGSGSGNGSGSGSGNTSGGSTGGSGSGSGSGSTSGSGSSGSGSSSSGSTSQPSNGGGAVLGANRTNEQTPAAPQSSTTVASAKASSSKTGKSSNSSSDTSKSSETKATEPETEAAEPETVSAVEKEAVEETKETPAAEEKVTDSTTTIEENKTALSDKPANGGISDVLKYVLLAVLGVVAVGGAAAYALFVRKRV